MDVVFGTHNVNETVELLAQQAPKLRAALRKAKRQGMAYVIIDGTLIPIDRVAVDRPFYSGKHKRHGVNLQVIASPDGTILWVSGQLPGSTHDTAAARIWNILAALRDSGLIALGDKGYHGYDETGQRVRTPYKGRNKPESQKEANRAHARLRGPGERANAQLKTWRVLRKLRCSRTAPAASPRPSTSYRTARSPQDGGSRAGAVAYPGGRSRSHWYPTVSRRIVLLRVPDQSAPFPAPARQSVHAVLPHTAYRRRSPPAFSFSHQGLPALGETTIP
jgi:hypothetical protein